VIYFTCSCQFVRVRSRNALRYELSRIGLFSGPTSTSSQMTQCRIILLFTTSRQALFTNELKLRDDFRFFRSKMCFRTFSTVPLNSPIYRNVKDIHVTQFKCHRRHRTRRRNVVQTPFQRDNLLMMSSLSKRAHVMSSF